ncbi:MAG: hypothetical protein ACLGIR_05045 [Actinomycetes bacterium]
MTTRTTARLTLVATVVATLGLVAGPASASCTEIIEGVCTEAAVCRAVPEKLGANCIE